MLNSFLYDGVPHSPSVDVAVAPVVTSPVGPSLLVVVVVPFAENHRASMETVEAETYLHLSSLLTMFIGEWCGVG